MAMTVQDAIKFFQHKHAMLCNCLNTANKMGLMKAAEVEREHAAATLTALDALRKREPAPVIRHKALGKIYLYFCPCCKKLINANFNSQAFCQDCGQALKWRNEDG